VVHICNPSYSRGRDRRIEDSQAKLAKPYLENKLKTKGLGAWLKW
jgi:hypothetical protein